MYKIDVAIAGAAPLLQHRRPYPEEEEINTAKRTSGVEDYSAEFEYSKYKTDDDRLYQPADHIVGAMTKSAVNFKITGKRGKTYKDLVKAAIFIEPDEIIHKVQDCVKDRRWVRVQRAGILRIRPRLDKWELDFTIVVIDDQFPPVAVENILKYAGQAVGIGDFRPRYGRFIVTSFEVTKDDKVTPETTA